MTKPRLMIHKFIDDYLNYPLDDYILTFDDGLYNHYTTYKKIIDKFPNIEMEYYISTNIIQDENLNQIDNIDAPDAHKLYFSTGDKSPYLKKSQIKEMNQVDNITIGLHGHNHLNLNSLMNKSLFERLEIFKQDSKKMIEKFLFFVKNKSIVIDSDRLVKYCTPYNQYKELEMAWLKKEFQKLGLTLFIIGKERIDIEKVKRN